MRPVAYFTEAKRVSNNEIELQALYLNTNRKLYNLHARLHLPMYSPLVTDTYRWSEPLKNGI